MRHYTPNLPLIELKSRRSDDSSTLEAYVTFKDPEAVTKLCRYPGIYLHGELACVRRAKVLSISSEYPLGHAIQSSNTILVERIAFTATVLNVREFFLGMGFHEQPYLQMLRDSRNRKAALATFSNANNAQLARGFVLTEQYLHQLNVGMNVRLKDFTYHDPRSGVLSKVPYYGLNDEVQPDDPFPLRLYKVLRLERYRNIVSWVTGSNDFRIHRTLAFKNQVLAAHFNLSLAEFKSSLNDYGFKPANHKLTWSHSEFKDDASEFVANMVSTPKQTVLETVALLGRKFDGATVELQQKLEDVRARVTANGEKLDVMDGVIREVNARVIAIENHLKA